jgi:hypothetical protein
MPLGTVPLKSLKDTSQLSVQHWESRDCGTKRWRR